MLDILEFYFQFDCKSGKLEHYCTKHQLADDDIAELVTQKPIEKNEI